MSNVEFLRTAIPPVHADCARAESYLGADPRSACFYSRRAIEVLVAHLYPVLGLPRPYRDDLAARIDDAGFRAVTGTGIAQKLTLIRRLGNTAVHEPRPIPPQVAQQVLRELHHVAKAATGRSATTCGRRDLLAIQHQPVRGLLPRASADGVARTVEGARGRVLTLGAAAQRGRHDGAVPDHDADARPDRQVEHERTYEVPDGAVVPAGTS